MKHAEFSIEWLTHLQQKCRGVATRSVTTATSAEKREWEELLEFSFNAFILSSKQHNPIILLH
jgi:hypothetical protein